MTTTCPECSFTYRIAPSKRTNPCPNCLSIQRTGETLQDKACRKAKAAMERSRIKSHEKQKANPKQKTPLPKFSEKGARQAREVARVKVKVKTEAADGQSFVECAGCGGFFSGLDGSHKVQLSKSSELASDANNIRLLCRGCHSKYGEGSVQEMLELKCLVDDLKYLFDFDPERFWKIHFRLVDEYNVRPTPKLERVLSKLEKFE